MHQFTKTIHEHVRTYSASAGYWASTPVPSIQTGKTYNSFESGYGREPEGRLYYVRWHLFSATPSPSHRKMSRWSVARTSSYCTPHAPNLDELADMERHPLDVENESNNN